jgi:hypothetical protein
MLPERLRRSHQLVLSYVLRGEARRGAAEYARDRGVGEQLVLTDWLSDEALRPLYQRCAAFVFPSMYEGFGLPLLEAMQCGAAVVAGNNSSQVEVVGGAGLLYNAADAGELGARLGELLSDPARARELGERAAARGRRFSWEATAQKLVGALGGRATPGAAPVRRPGRRAPRRRVAYFAPLPPQACESAAQSERLLEELGRRYAVDVYHDAAFLPHVGLRSPRFACHDHRLFERNAAALGYHGVIFRMGGSTRHAYMLDALLRYSGVVDLHDHELDFGAGTGETRLDGRILDRAAAVVVHSPRHLEQVRMRFPAHLARTFLVPLEATPPGRSWSAMADAYGEIIEWVAAGRRDPRADGTPSGSQFVTSSGSLQAAS